ncbi:MAG: type II secretion system protein J [Pirellulales bacterium]
MLLPGKPNYGRTSIPMPAVRLHRQTGFTLIELMVVTATMAFLSMLIAGIWAGLARSSTDTMAQARLVSAAQFALESFRRDLAGSLPENPNGTRLQGMMVGSLVTSDARLLLCFDGAPMNEVADWAAPDTVIVYEVQNGQLIRTDQQSGTAFVVADNVSAFSVTQLAGGLRIELTVVRGNFTRTYTLVSQDP